MINSRSLGSRFRISTGYVAPAPAKNPVRCNQDNLAGVSPFVGRPPMQTCLGVPQFPHWLFNDLEFPGGPGLFP